MYEVIFYRTKDGKEPVGEYLEQLSKRKDKESRVKFEKITDYIQILAQYGTRAGLPYVKHLIGDLWELRPMKDRIFFVGLAGGKFVLLHCFVKKTQKTPKSEIDRAKRELADLLKRSEER